VDVHHPLHRKSGADKNSLVGITLSPTFLFATPLLYQNFFIR